MPSEDALGPPPELRIAERWADFTRAFAIYPEKSVRVSATLAAFHEALEEGDAGHGTVILFHEKHLVHADKRHPVAAGSSLGWLHARLQHAGLAGVEFQPGVSDEALIALSRQLLSNFLKKEVHPTFESLWPDTYENVELMDRRFDGTFGEAGGAEGTHRRVMPPLDGPHADGFLASLLREEEVSQRLRKAATDAGGEALSPSEETRKATDVLKHIIDEMSVDAVADRETLITNICQVLDKLAGRDGAPEDKSQIEGVALDALLDADDESAFAALLKDVSLTHFRRGGTDAKRLKPDHKRETAPSDSGRRRDDAITDNVDEFLAELEHLPPDVAVKLDDGHAESAPEQLAVMLHFLNMGKRSGDLPSLDPILSALLETPGPDELRVLRLHLGLEAAEGETAAAEIPQPFLDHLRRTGRLDLLRHCGVLSKERLAAAFPLNFVLYLSSLEPVTPYDLEDLDWICRSVGAERMRAAERLLRVPLSGMSPQQLTSYLDRPTQDRLPLVRLLLTLRPQELQSDVIRYLRTLDLPESEAFLLYQMPDQRFLSLAYLQILIDDQLGEADRSTIRDTVSDVLCAHIEDEGARDLGSSERLASIRSLAKYPSVRGWGVLKELGRTQWVPFGRREPAAVRKLARSIRKRYQAA